MHDEHTILIADDDWMNREVMQSFFESAGFRVALANDGEQALRLARAHMPDVVLVDVRMSGFDGYDVCAALKGDTATAAIKVVLITAHERGEDAERAAAVGADDFVTKSLDWNTIVERVHVLLV